MYYSSCEVNSIPVSQALCSALSVDAVMVACEMEPLLSVMCVCVCVCARVCGEVVISVSWVLV